ncbi:hypothetical protein FisN_9Hu218 [Fistulifera solaris]|uniref:Uncharacterized protein n=1 Tax=Fistulifera solaris TaxID=1519565 RepID=A0A1Z5JAW2_FISSO|nr:hypothetical protein FisN_9Hu218 [Fistulifera solaris]|eukprot:GAX11127.1 hypothetical protein FisN_9Hu218 [Fistulifera solaris]
MKRTIVLQTLGLSLALQMTHARLHGRLEERILDCSSDNDCAADSEYCSRGSCRPFGACETVADCMNPSNLHFIPQCIGYRTCEAGFCGMVCSERSCSSEDLELETVTCLIRPCDALQCDESYESCVDDYCGGCNALFFDAAGQLICTKSEQETRSCVTDYASCRNEDGITRQLTCLIEMTQQMVSCALQP